MPYAEAAINFVIPKIPGTAVGNRTHQIQSGGCPSVSVFSRTGKVTTVGKAFFILKIENTEFKL